MFSCLLFVVCFALHVRVMLFALLRLLFCVCSRLRVCSCMLVVLFVCVVCLIGFVVWFVFVLCVLLCSVWRPSCLFCVVIVCWLGRTLYLIIITIILHVVFSLVTAVCLHSTTHLLKRPRKHVSQFPFVLAW